MVYNPQVALAARQAKLAEDQAEAQNDPGRVFLKSLASAGGQSIASTLGNMAVSAAKYKLFGGERTLQEVERKNKAAEAAARNKLAETIRSNKAGEDLKLQTEERKKLDAVLGPLESTISDVYKSMGAGSGARQQMTAAQNQVKAARAKLAKQGASPRVLAAFDNRVQGLAARGGAGFDRMSRSTSGLVEQGGAAFQIRGAEKADPGSVAERNTKLIENFMKLNSALEQSRAKLEGDRAKLETLGVTFSGGKPVLSGDLDTTQLKLANKYIDEMRTLQQQQKSFNTEAEEMNRLDTTLPFYLKKDELGDYSVQQGLPESDELERLTKREDARLAQDFADNNYATFGKLVENATSEELKTLGFDPAKGLTREEFTERLLKSLRSGRRLGPEEQSTLFKFVKTKQKASLERVGIKSLEPIKIPERSSSEVDDALQDPSMFDRMIRERLKAENVTSDSETPQGLTFKEELYLYYKTFPEEARKDMYYVLSKTPMGMTAEQRTSYIETNIDSFYAGMRDGATSKEEIEDRLKQYGVSDETERSSLARTIQNNKKTFNKKLIPTLYNAMNQYSQATGGFEFTGELIENKDLKAVIGMNKSLAGLNRGSLLKVLTDEELSEYKTRQLTQPEINAIFNKVMNLK
jgi:hypothetical protein